MGRVGAVLERTLQKARPGPGCWAEKGIGGGPVLAVYVYPDEEYKETLRLVDSTTSYGLTGAVFAQDK